MRLRNIKVVKDRKGAPRYYFQVKGRPLIRLPNGPTDSADFHAAWEAARAASQGAADTAPTPEAIRRSIARALRKATHRARAKGREVTVTLDDLEVMYRRQRGRCALTGIPLSFEGKKTTRNPWMLSIDRIESAGGYVAGNVHLVTTMANLAKAEFTMLDFRRMCQSAAEQWSAPNG